MAIKVFEIPFDPAIEDFRPVDVRARMLYRSPTGESTPVEMASVQFSAQPGDIIQMTPRKENEVWVASARLASQVYSRSDFDEVIKNDIQVTCRGIPVTGQGGAQPVISRCLVRIQQPGGEIHWRFLQDGAYGPIDQGVVLTADGQSRFVLQVWYNLYHPGQRKLYYHPDRVQFTHQLDKSAPQGVLGPAPGSTVKGRDNGDATEWASLIPYPDPGYGRRPMPVESRLWVNAWPRGETVSAQPLARVGVPLRLTDVRFVVKLVDPLTPIPADGNPVRVLLQAVREKDGAPLVGRALSWVFKSGSQAAGGKVEPAEGVTDAQGQVSLFFTPPQLYYRPGANYLAELAVHAGSERKSDPVATVQLPLAPALQFQLEATKAGLCFEPVEVTLDPERETTSVVEGMLKLAAQEPETEIESWFPIDHAEVAVKLWDGRSYVPGSILTTTPEGMFTWELPELADVCQGRPALTLQAEEGMTPPATLDDAMRTTISHYEDNSRNFFPYHLWGSELGDKLKCYRMVYCRQVAGKAPDQMEKIKSGAILLGTAAAYTRTYDKMVTSQWARLKEDFKNILIDAFALLLTVHGVADKMLAQIKGMASTAAVWLKKKGATAVAWSKRFLKWSSTTLVSGLRRIAVQLQGAARAMMGWAKSTTGVLKTFFTTLVNEIGRGARKLMAEIDDLLKKLAQQDKLGIVQIIESVMTTLSGCVVTVGRAVWNMVAVLTGELVEFFAKWAKVFAEGLDGVRNLAQPLFDELKGMLQEVLEKGLARARALYGRFCESAANDVDHLMKERMPHFENSFSKLLEVYTQLFFATFLGFSAKADQRAGAGDPGSRRGMVDQLLELLEPMRMWAEPVIERVYAAAETLQVPADAAPSVDRLRRQVAQTAGAQLHRAKANILVDTWLEIFDTALLVVEIGSFLIAGVMSFGIAPIPLAGFFTQVEIASGAVKLAVFRAPQAISSLVYSWDIAMIYAAQVRGLTFQEV